MRLFSGLRIRSHMRLFLIFILTLILPLLILTAVFLHSYQTIYENEVQQSICNEMEAVVTNMDTQCQAAATYAAVLSQDADLQKYLAAAGEAPQTDPHLPPLELVVRRYMNGKPSMLNVEIIVLASNGEVLMGQRYLGIFRDTEFFRDVMETSYRSPLKSTFWFYEQQFEDVAASDSHIYVVRPVTNSSNWNALGYVILRFRNSDFISMYLNSTNESRSVFVLDSDGEVISGIDPLGVTDAIAGGANHQMLLSESLKMGDNLIYISTLSNLWYLVSATNTKTVVRSELTVAIELYVLILVLCILLTMAVSYIMSKRFVRPVKILTREMQEVEQGNFHSRAMIHTKDEFEDLANSYNKMIQRVEELMRQTIFEQEQRRESDIRMLQAQINPHFLYNTLATIRCMIYTNPPQEVDQVILALSRFLKYVLSNADTVYVSLDWEFEQLNDYITIQQFGFEVPLKYQVEIEPGLGHCMVVKMLFQPLVENAILHGLKLNNVDPTLHIRVYSTEDGSIQIDISDNGAGFDVTAVAETASKDKMHHHLGMSNVRQRLWLHYGESCSFEVHSVKGKGTTAQIKIPKLTEEDMRNEGINR